MPRPRTRRPAGTEAEPPQVPPTDASAAFSSAPAGDAPVRPRRPRKAKAEPAEATPPVATPAVRRPRSIRKPDSGNAPPVAPEPSAEAPIRPRRRRAQPKTVESTPEASAPLSVPSPASPPSPQAIGAASESEGSQSPAGEGQPSRRRRGRGYWSRRREKREQAAASLDQALGKGDEAAVQRSQKRTQRKAETPEQQRRKAEAASGRSERRAQQQQTRREEQKRRQQEAQAQRRAQQQNRKRPTFGSTWWSARWTAVLETFGWAARVARGAEYARQGAVRDLNMDEWGVVTALVQGSRPEPYLVELSMVHLPDEIWERILAEMSNNALLAAKLLAGEMPEDIEEAFYAAGMTLFPYDGQEILAACSCPDQVNPCKHIAAVFYTLAQEFDRDPFLIFRFRGRSGEQIAAALRALRAEAETVEEEEILPATDEVLPLDQCLDRFWTIPESLHSFRVAIAPPATPGAVLLRLGQPNGWDGARGFIFTMAPYYQTLSEKALAAAFAEVSASNGQALATPAASV